MVEFLKSYGVWIFVVTMLGIHLVPMFRRGRGMGCGMGGQGHGQEESGKKDGQQESGKQSPGCH